MSGNSPFYKLRNAQSSPLTAQVMLEQCGLREKRSRSTQHPGDVRDASWGNHSNSTYAAEEGNLPKGHALGLSTTQNAIQDQQLSPLLPQQEKAQQLFSLSFNT